MKKHLKVLVVLDTPNKLPDDHDFSEEFKTDDWKAEAHVTTALKELGHETQLLGVFDDITPIIQKVEEFQPDIIFNLTEIFRNLPSYDMNIVALFELLNVNYTGTKPPGLHVCKNKGLAKKILSYHRIKTPAFRVFEQHRKIALPKKLKYPILIKPLREEASYGISQNSLVDNDKDFIERIQFVHESMDRDAIAEEFVEGRELYVSLLGKNRLQVLPFRELVFENVPEDEPKFATFKAKWDDNYRKKYGIKTRFVLPLPEKLPEKIARICKKVFRLLYINGYGRIDLRITPNNDVVILEANPNPYIAKDDDFGLAAQKAGTEYNDLIQRILRMGMGEK